MNHKQVITFCIVVICLTISFISVVSVYSTHHIDEVTKTTTSTSPVTLGQTRYNGLVAFAGSDIYPGYKAIQKFTVYFSDVVSDGTYEIDLKALVPEVFDNDIEVTLYKTNDENNSISRIEGMVLEDGSREDILSFHGSLEAVYGPTTLTNSDKIVLETCPYTIPGFNTETYYLIYHVKNDGIQDNQEGKVFSGQVSIQLLQK